MTLRDLLPYTFKLYHLRTENFKFPSYLESVARYRGLTLLVLEDKSAQLAEQHALPLKQCNAQPIMVKFLDSNLSNYCYLTWIL